MMTSRIVFYRDQQTQLEGELIIPAEIREDNRAILLFHECYGPGAYLSRHVNCLVEQGYPVFVADFYGMGRVSLPAEIAAKVAQQFIEDRQLMCTRALAALTAMKQQLALEDDKIFVLGFSFGGCAALELSRTGLGLAGVINVYGYLDTPNLQDSSKINSPVLVILGGCDPVVWNSELLDFLDDMARFGIDCQIKIFSEAAHGFCNKDLPEVSGSGNCYSAKYEMLAWEEIFCFLQRSR